MVIYEITAVVEPGLAARYEKYMTGRHIPDLLATGYFISATFLRSGDHRFRIRYKAVDRAALDEYFRSQAERLRADFKEHFPAGVDLARETWDVLGEFDTSAPQPSPPI
jgi:hypothetical protein